MKHACQCPDCQGTRLNPCREDCECENGLIDTGGFDPHGNPIFVSCPECIGAERLSDSSIEKWLELLEAAKTLIGLHPEAHPIAHAHSLARLSKAIEAIDNQIP